MPKILAIHNVGQKDNSKESAVHIWRIWRPLEELKKHVDWQIDHQPTFIKNIEKYKDLSEFTNEEVEKAGRHLGSYDIVYSSYHLDAAAHSLMMAVSNRYGTKFVLDDDDNTFAIDPTNPFWISNTHDQAFVMQRICRTSEYITTTTDSLAQVFKDRTEADAKVFVLPNYIPDTYKEGNFDNGDKVVIGYFGGSSHYFDIHESGLLPALRRIMHEYKNVHFKSVSMPIDAYLPKARTHIIEGAYGRQWVDKLFPTLDFDIALAPLKETLFADGKSNIKWQESTRMGAAFIASDVGPYKDLKDGRAILVQNDEESWYNALKELVESKEKRQKLVTTARKDLQANWRLEDEKNWGKYKQVFEEIANDN